MSKINFNLDKKSTGNDLVMLIYRHDLGQFKFSTGVHIPTGKWNLKKQRAFTGDQYPGGRASNARLDLAERCLQQILEDFYKAGVIPSNKQLRDEMRVRYKGDDSSPGRINDLMSFVSLLIEERRGVFGVGAMKKYVTTRNHLLEFLGQSKLLFENLTRSDYAGFRDYLYNRDFSDRHVANLIKTMSLFVTAAIRDDRTTAESNPYNAKDLGISIPPSDNIYLNPVEIQQLLDCDLTGCDRLCRVRDFFVVQCYTGMRYGDLMNLTFDNIIRDVNGIKTIEYESEKTGAIAVIPMKPIVVEILERYNYRLNFMSGQKMNVYLKELGERVGLNATFKKRIFKRGRITVIEGSKYQFLTTHTGRRSFVTNALEAGIPPHRVKRMTSHKSDRVFESYVKITERANAVNLVGHEFFQ